MPTRRAVPQPDDVRTPAEFVALMRQLQHWSGLSLEELEARTANIHALPPDGLAGMLDGGTLPSPDLVSAFISACGCVPEIQAEWLRVHTRVASPSPDSEPRPPAKPAAASEPTVPPPPDKTQPEEQAKRRRPRHRKSSAKRTRRSLSPLVAAPAFITVAVIGVAMFTALDDDSGKNENKHSGELSASAPPTTGWYFVQPETAVSAGNCLTILPDDQFAPTLSQDKCDDEDRLQRIRLETHSNGTYVVQARTNKDQLWCLTLDTPNDGARLHLSVCDSGNKWQRFNLERTKPQAQTTAQQGTSQPTPLYNLQSAQTRRNEMCVGIDSSHPGTIHAVHTTCTKTTIWGYTFVPTMAPAGT
ncbi:hypothetical protein GCM10010191_09440 [Actinomadura vinacea]|uniref:Ricin B lectin domain-containing protein n=1 Tax=Actinomadura vinacea TaxID=115336 RepID=A0ABP5VI84_9ACTN